MSLNDWIKEQEQRGITTRQHPVELLAGSFIVLWVQP